MKLVEDWIYMINSLTLAIRSQCLNIDVTCVQGVLREYAWLLSLKLPQSTMFFKLEELYYRLLKIALRPCDCEAVEKRL